MPLVKFVEILSYSSESKNYPAENLLKNDEYHKWKCKEGTKDTQSWVILKLEKLSSITSIDIGNENSAIIEVLVGREGVEYKVLVVASSFMTPLESRNGSNTNRVRIFNRENLQKQPLMEKWDRIKVICTQPFAKNVQYGLSFIKLLSNDEKSSDKEVKLGRFTLKEENYNSDTIKIGSFFNLKKEQKEKAYDKLSITGPAAIRAASNAIRESYMAHKENDKDLNAPNLGFYQLKKTTKDHPPVKEINNSSPSSSPNPLPKDEHKKGTPKIVDTKTFSKNESQELKNLLKNGSQEPKLSKGEPAKESKTSSAAPTKNIVRKRKSRPFAKLMEGVTFVMSGYQNPLRSNLRDKMLDMGAKYKGDWDGSCTHLICAFTNTPKFQAVKGKGKIVSEKWIEESHKRKMRLPWRRYNIEKNRNADESEEEVYAEEILPKEEKDSANLRFTDEVNEEQSPTDSEDTDEEINRIMNRGDLKRKTKENPPTTSNKRLKLPSMEGGGCSSKAQGGMNLDDTDPFDADTDIDEEDDPTNLKRTDTSKLPLPPLGSYFTGKVFFLYGEMEDSTQKMLTRYIFAHNGKVSNYMSNDVQFVITEDAWDHNFEEALNENPSLQFVKPQWIWKCCDKRKFVRPQPFLIVPH